MQRSGSLMAVAVLGLLGSGLAIGSDHIDGPRTTAEPAADLTDLFAFRSPEHTDRTVLIANIFAFAGDSAFFSNAVNYTIAMRPVRVAGLGNRARFQTGVPEVRFTCQFGVLESQAGGTAARQRGACSLPGDRKVEMIVGDEQGGSTPDGVFRVFAGLRSDSFYDGWGIPPRTAMPEVLPNVVQDNNTLSIVIEFETTKVVDLKQGSLFGVIAETTPRAAASLTAPPRIDWVGRPEMTNFRLKVQGEIDVRDVWNQETPFAITPERMALYRERMLLSLELWDKRDGKVDWTPAGLRAETNVFLDDFLLIDVARPTTDDSHLEIERSTIEGKPYVTGGGRTLDANVMDIMISYHVNRGNGPFIRGGATGATQAGGSVFPYEKPPNPTSLTATRTIDVAAGCEQVWKTVGRFDGEWHPLIASVETVGTGVGQLRKVQTVDGSVIVERLERLDNDARFIEYLPYQRPARLRLYKPAFCPGCRERLSGRMANELSVKWPGVLCRARYSERAPLHRACAAGEGVWRTARSEAGAAGESRSRTRAEVG